MPKIGCLVSAARASAHLLEAPAWLQPQVYCSNAQLMQASVADRGMFCPVPGFNVNKPPGGSVVPWEPLYWCAASCTVAGTSSHAFLEPAKA
jgi:hypothetical protein